MFAQFILKQTCKGSSPTRPNSSKYEPHPSIAHSPIDQPTKDLDDFLENYLLLVVEVATIFPADFVACT
jgi:hypothetical protein